MGDALGQMLTSAVGIALSPIPLIAVVLMLTTPRGRANGAAFTLAWAAALGTVVTIVLASTPADSATAGGEAPATWVLRVKLAFGVLFIAMAAVQWRNRPGQENSAAEPGWMKAIDTCTPARAAGLAAALAVANPKNLALAVGGTLSIAGSGTSTGGRVTAAVVMVVISSLCTLVPLTVYFLGGTRSTRVLDGWKTWMSAHSTAIVLTGLVVLGAKYTGDAISGLTG